MTCSGSHLYKFYRFNQIATPWYTNSEGDGAPLRSWWRDSVAAPFPLPRCRVTATAPRQTRDSGGGMGRRGLRSSISVVRRRVPLLLRVGRRGLPVAVAVASADRRQRCGVHRLPPHPPVWSERPWRSDESLGTQTRNSIWQPRFTPLMEQWPETEPAWHDDVAT
jgi:hypothetical protein